MVTDELQEGRAELGAAAVRCVSERRQVDAVECAERLDESGVDLGFGDRAWQLVEYWSSKVEVVLGKLEVEERGFPFLELRWGRQHVVGELCGFGHRNVDDDDELQRLKCFAHAGAVGERVSGVRRFDDHRPIAVGMVGEDLLGDHVARHKPGDDGCADDRGGTTALRPRLRRPAGRSQ